MHHPSGSALADSSVIDFQTVGISSSVQLRAGDQVRITRGSLRGLTGWLCAVGSPLCLAQLSVNGDGIYARVPQELLEPIGR